MTALDDYTVAFTLAEPFAAFPIQLVLPPIVPADSGDRMRTFPVGTGPYRFVRYDVDDKVVLSAFEGYWNGPPEQRRRRREGRSPTTRCAASICARARPTWSSTTCRRTSCTS